jgi:GNAT superfamily N-acetyltransferase
MTNFTYMMYKISTDKSKLDIPLIHEYLSNHAYWAKGRTIEKVAKTIEHCICFGVYDQNNQQVGFARVLTDYAIFFYLMDVFILESHRGQGLSKMLMSTIMQHEDLQGLNRYMLATSDAHGLYRQYGFNEIEKPHIFMEIVNLPISN